MVLYNYFWMEDPNNPSNSIKYGIYGVKVSCSKEIYKTISYIDKLVLMRVK
jgi:hypothetical protein